MNRDLNCVGCNNYVSPEECQYYNDHFPTIECAHCVNHSNHTKNKKKVQETNYYNPETPKQTKSRFRNVTFYRNCEYKCQYEQRIKIEKLLKKIQDSKNREDWLSDLFNILQDAYTMIENKFSSIEIITANKNHLEKMIKIYESETKND